MRILLLNQVFYPDSVATAQHMYDLAVHLVEKGHEVTVVAGQRAYENRQVKFPLKETIQGIRVCRIPSTGLGKTSILRRVVDSVSFELGLVWRLLLTPRQDVVVAFTSPPLIGLFATLYCALKGGKLVQWMMDVNPDTAIAVGYLREGSLIARVLTALFRFSLRKSDHVVVLDRWMKLRMENHGASEKNIVVIPPWPVQRLEVSETGGEAFKREIGLAGKFVVLYSGNHSVVHPLDTVLQAALRLRSDKDIAFVFIGKGLRTADVDNFKSEHQLPNIYRLPPQPREKLHESLAAGDLHVVVMGPKVSGLVHTSKLYGVLATGKPYVFIGPNESHGVDLLNECPGGYHVEHGDVEKFIATIEAVKNMKASDRQKMAEINRNYLRDNFVKERLLVNFDRVLSTTADDAPGLLKTFQLSTEEKKRSKLK